MIRKHSLIVTMVIAAWTAVLGFTVVARAEHDDPPSASRIAFAKQVSDLMLNELVAALFKEFDETTAQNVPHGKQAISLIFNDVNRDMRLIGEFPPLLGGSNDRPSDRFERIALKRALEGDPLDDVQQINDTWNYRRSVPLSNAMHQNCVRCHANFTPALFVDNPEQWVGTLVLGIPIR